MTKQTKKVKKKDLPILMSVTPSTVYIADQLKRLEDAVMYLAKCVDRATPYYVTPNIYNILYSKHISTKRKKS